MALREILAVFDVQVDPKGQLAAGTAKVSRLQKSLNTVDAAAKKFSESLRRAGAASQLAGRKASDGWLTAGTAASKAAGTTQGASEKIKKSADKAAKATEKAAKRTTQALKKTETAAKRVRKSVEKPMVTKISTRTASKDLGEFQRKIAGFRVKIGLIAFALGGFGFGLGKIFSSVLTEADKIGKSAARLGVDTDSFQVLKQFAEESGTSIESATNSVRRLQRSIAEAGETGKGPAADAFRKLGINITGTEDALDLLFEAGGKISELEHAAQRTAVAFDLFGRAGTELLPGFKNGSAAALKQRDDLRSLAVVYEKEMIANVEAANDAMSRARLQFRRISATLVSDFLPALLSVSNKLTPLVINFSKWLKQLDFVSIGLTSLVGSLALVSSVIGPLGVALTSLLRIFLRFVLPALIIEDLIQTMRGGDTVTRDFIDALFGVGATTKVVEGLANAFEFVVDAVKVLFALFTGENAGDVAIDEFEKKWTKAITNIKEVFQFLWRDIKIGLVDVLDTLSQLIKFVPIVGPVLSLLASGGSALADLAGVGDDARARQAAGIIAPASISTGARAAAAGPTANDSRTQSVTVNVGSVGEVRSAVQSAQSGFGRGPAADLAAVGG